MKNSSVVVGIGITGLMVVFALAGYMVGMKSSVSVLDRSGTSGFASSPSEQASIGAAHPPILKDLEAKLTENPDDPKLLAHIGDIYFEMRNYKKAIDYYSRVIELNPDDVDSYNDLGLSNHYIGNSAKGLEIVEAGIKKNPYHQRIWLTKGFILAYGMGDLKAAREAWEKAKALDPESQVGKAAADFLAQFSDEKK